VRRTGVVIELDPTTLMAASRSRALAAAIHALLPEKLSAGEITFEPYRVGSAFVGARP
jgi:uncharacterized protein